MLYCYDIIMSGFVLFVMVPCNYSAYQNMSIDVDSDENVENNK
jgi:hypothetical protein